MVVGIDNRIENNIARINLEISEKKKDEEALKTEIMEFQNREEALEDRIGELAQEGHKTTVSTRFQKATLEILKESNEHENIANVLLLIKHVNQELDQIKDKMGKLLEEQDQLDKKIKDFESQSSRSKKRVHIPKEKWKMIVSPLR